jgi:integrase
MMPSPNEKALVVTGQTDETKAAYYRRAKQIIARVDREQQASEQRCWKPDDLPGYLAALMSALRHRSWRQYKAALVAFVRTQVANDPTWQQVLDRLIGLQWKSADNPAAKCLPLLTSAKKAKSPKADQLAKLQLRLELDNEIAAAFLKATLIAGLRPIEWAGANIDVVGDRWQLRVQNAKTTNARAHGQYRTLWFDRLDFQQVMAMKQTISSFKAANSRSAVANLEEKIERAFRSANNALWPTRKKSITPYTARHVFAARVKLAYKSEEVAALMGHADDRTAFRHYGRQSRKKSGGVGPPLPTPDPEEVKRVRLMRAAALEKLANAKKKSPPTQKPDDDPDLDDPDGLQPEAPTKSRPK